MALPWAEWSVLPQSNTLRTRGIVGSSVTDYNQFRAMGGPDPPRAGRRLGGEIGREFESRRDFKHAEAWHAADIAHQLLARRRDESSAFFQNYSYDDSKLCVSLFGAASACRRWRTRATERAAP